MIRLIIRQDFWETEQSQVWILKNEDGKRYIGKIVFEDCKAPEGLIPNEPSFSILNSQLAKSLEQDPFKIMGEEIKRLNEIIFKMIENKK